MKISTFLGPNATPNGTRFARCYFRAPKSLDLQGPPPPPSNGPSKWICPHQNHYIPRRVNNRYINSYKRKAERKYRGIKGLP
jgi:hypothetical protein